MKMSKINTNPKTNQVLSDSYIAKGTIGNTNLPGAAIAYFSLDISQQTKSVSGVIEVSQPITQSVIKINVVGAVKPSITKHGNSRIELIGEFVVSINPPASGTYLEYFTAYLDIDANWQGLGGFSYGKYEVNDVPISLQRKLNTA
ncbi:conserved hypothetical protein [Tenacibaculum litopenaei]|jgi:hypothetical protein|uniref:DUF1842 domain-containing protein n=1 Tax=Tenacibaculum litopenaei TaxID=396016 RepID=UPI0038967F90